MPELQHNVALLVSLTEAQLQKLDARLQHEQDTATILAKEKERLQQELEAHTGSLHRLAELTQAVARCQVQSKSAGLTLDQLHATYSALQANYPVEYQLYQLQLAALPLVLPRLRSQLGGWAPLQEPLRAASEFARWRPLLESEAARQRVLSDAAAAAAGGDHAGGTRGSGLGSGEEDAYAVLVWELVVPPVRSAITGEASLGDVWVTPVGPEELCRPVPLVSHVGTMQGHTLHHEHAQRMIAAQGVEAAAG
jgi:tuftelin-interacting protein 11